LDLSEGRRSYTTPWDTIGRLRRLRERVLRAGARLVLSVRRMALALSSSVAHFWTPLWPRIARMHWARP
jgi:hypothetical protein